MDDSWQMKCSSTWQPLMPSSFQLQPQEPRNQMWNACHFYPHAAEESSSVARGRRQETMVPKKSNLFSDNSGHADLGSPFLSLLSGQPQFLQCDLQQFSSPKPFVSSSKVPVNSDSLTVGAAGNGVSLFQQNLGTQNSKIGADLSPVVSSTGMANATYGSGFNLSDVLEATNLKHQSSEIPRPVICHSNASNVKVRDFSCLNGGWLSSTSPSDAGKSHGASAQTSQKAPLETNSPISRCSSTFTSGCPRVFCLGVGGDLLLSNTGLLGVVCFCHGLHMSISKFAEHSGLCGVNPGDAVHMDSGETIAQWRNLYFHKFGIRVPEDHNGWDWPDGFLTTPGSVKRCMAVSDVPNNSDLSNLVGASGRLVWFGQPQNSFACLKNPNSGPTLVNEGIYNAKQRNTQDDCNFLRKGLLGSSHSDLPPVADNQILGSSMSGFSMMSKSNGAGGPDNGRHSISAYIDSISKSGQSFISHENLHNSKSSGNDSDFSRFYNLKGSVMDRDVISSSIELRLGQPSTQTLGNCVVPAFRSHPFDTHCDQKSLFPEQSIYNGNYRAIGECSQYLQHAAGSSNSCARICQNQSNLVNHEIVINNARNAAIIEQLKGDADRSSVISMLLSQFKTPDERMHSKATGGVIDGFHVTSRTLQSESHVAKCDPANAPFNRSYSAENQLNINRLGLQKHVGKGKEVAHAADSLRVATEPKFDFHTKHVESSINCNGIGGTGHRCCFTIHDKSSHPYQFSGTTTDAHDARNPFNHPGKIPCFGLTGHLDYGSCRSSLPIDSGPNFPSQAISMGSSATASNCVLNMLPAATNKEGCGGSPSLDENLRMLALRRLIALSNQGHSNVSPGTNVDQGRLSNTFAEKLHSSIADSTLSDGQRHGFVVSSKEIASEVSIKPLQSGFNSWMGGDADSAGGLNKWCSFSPFSLGNPLHSKNIEMQCQLSCDPHPNEQPLGRYGRVENNVTSNEHGKCCQRVPCTYLPGNCGCTVHTNCLGVNCNSKAETLSSASKERTGSLNGMASVFFAPSAKGTSTSPKEKSISSNQGRNLGQVRKKVECHAFQWRDVPSKATGMHNLTCKDCPVDLLDRSENVAEQTAAATKCFERSAQDAESSKEQEISNISSGCSAAAVTQASVEFNNLGSAAVGAGDKCTQNLVVDEGSGIDKCWSSDDPPDSERSSEFFGFASKNHSANKGSSKPLPNQSSRSLIDELRLRDSLILKTVRNPVHKGVSIVGKANHTQESEMGIKSAKSKRPTKWKKLDESFSDSGTGSVHWHSHSSKDMQIRVQPDQGRSCNCACSGAANLDKRSVLCSSKNISRKRDLHGLYNDRDGENGNILLKAEDDHLEVPERSCKKRFRLGRTAQTVKQLGIQEPYCADTGINVKSNSADFKMTSSTEEVDMSKQKVRPVACGKYGILSNGVSSGPAKIVSLRKILKSARRYTLAENDQLNLASAKKSKRSIRGCKGCIDKERGCVGHDDMVSSELDPDNCVNGTETVCSSGGKELDVPCMFENEKGNEGDKDHKIVDSCLKTRLKPKCKETRKRSLYELSIKGKDSSYLDVSGIYMSNSLPQKKCRYLAKFLKNSEDGKCRAGAISSAKSSEEQQCQSLISHADAFCCVCGSSNKDEINCLLECGRCSIRVHQACYGVSKVPRGRWYCRPCRTSSKNIVCVLCGYGGGAMTRALRSRNIVKSLLKAWNIITESVPKDIISPPEVLEDRFSILDSSTSGVGSNSFPVIRTVPMEPSYPVWKMDLHKQLNRVNNSSCSPGNMKVHNSITAGFLDSTVKQWVHMVCGLWTPTTRCPNVDTMSAFDVSGASCPKANLVCSMCNRPGGSCIQCRVRDCSVPFHPWCAHQKGLLQSEVEGVDNENVGFYGRCILHAAYHQCDSDADPIDTEACQPGEQEYTCARTEGYKGRKREGFRHDIPRQSNGYGGCVVPQDQLNAWLHINRQKSCPKGLPKLPISDVEYDCRKEYARYKQSKGWKHLVVYKSGIHALGLYTSQFISRGAMVVEYVGEIVGLRVSDKRESEYQSGRKLQYKSACYFFRIDKEHIIDATRKGGIARFVNHSCLPNCVAKVISVKNEKKVVFFAERDIYPGEEITYDYHFNHEDEGKKIPCFCNSKNCRRYLN